MDELKPTFDHLNDPYVMQLIQALSEQQEAITEAIALIDDPDIPSVSKAYVARERLAREVEGE